MSLKQFKKIAGPSREVNQLQENVEQVISPIIDKQVIDGILIKDISITSGTAKTINHKLGREIVGYIIVKKDANATIWDSQSTNINSKHNLILNSSTNVTINLWVF